jgi:Flp pilus assembly protein TadG
MALVAPVLFTLVFGSIEFGRAMMVSNTVTTAAREGARKGVLPNGTSSEIQTAVTDVLTASSVPTTHATITVLVDGAAADASTATTGKPISVTVSVPYADVTWLPTPIFLSSAQLSGRAVMRRE